MLKEFKEFAMKGSVLDLAVGVIIGAAFGKIVTSFVEDIIMPVVGLATGKVDFANKFISLNGASYPTVAAAKAAGAPTLNYGMFLNNVLNFLIVAFVIFLVVRQINRMKREPAPAVVTPDSTECPFCVSTVALKATRCPNCTSELVAVPA